MKLSIVTVNFNNRDYLRECLRSIFAYPLNDSFEVIVVDNGSHDGSVDMVRQEFPHVNCIANPENVGFGSANNQGIRIAQGEYVLLLNDDAEVKEGTLNALVDYMKTHPEAGVIGSKIVYPDGRLQPSVRRFPSFWSQFLVLFPWARAVKNYFWHDFDYEKEQETEQIMGACMMFRKSVLDAVGIFDETFFIWFEEVDLLKRVRDAGYKIWYVPSIVISHVGGATFSQQARIRKYRMYSASCRTYMLKHKGFFAWLALTLLYPLGFAVVWLKNQPAAMKEYKRFSLALWLWAVLGILTVECLSFVGWSHDSVNAGMFWILGLITLAVSLYRLEYGVMIALAELVIGSKGGLFSWQYHDHVFNVRVLIFAALGLAWVIKYLVAAVQKRTVFPVGYLTIRHSSYRWWYVAMAAMIIGGTAFGLLENAKGLALADANAWYFFLLAPIAYDVLIKKETVTKTATVAAAALGMQIMKTLFILYVMAHSGLGSDVLMAVYRWVRDTGVGEVTMVTANVYRTFLQSQIYLLPALLGCLAYLAWGKQGKRPYTPTYLGRILWSTALIAGGILVSQSRSFWLALAVCLAGLVAAVVKTNRVQPFGIWMAKSASAAVLAVAVLAGVILFPIPSNHTDLGLSAVSGRFNADESAVGSRWNLFPIMIAGILPSPIIGHGFGKTLTYHSKDPRVLEQDPTGTYTTYAFEWGYLEIILKVGLLGLAIYLGFLVSVLRKGWNAIAIAMKGGNGSMIAWLVGLWGGLVALLITHFFTPYLNHPLGISYIVLAGLVFERMYPRANASDDMTLLPSGWIDTTSIAPSES